MQPTLRLLPEWAEQEAVVLAWPDEDTDWAPWLTEVRGTYRQLISTISQNGVGVILLVRPSQIAVAESVLEGLSHTLLVSANYNDTWCRDYVFLTGRQGSQNIPVEFTFNGWGQKFDATKDNLINKKVLAPLCKQAMISHSLVAEGGAIEIDQHGHLLSTQLCLLNPLRNNDFSLSQYDNFFKKHLGVSRFTAFKHGHLEGDDTDGHIDTLVRYTPDGGLVIQSCFNMPQDVHFDGLNALVNEVSSCFPDSSIYELPLPKILNKVGERLPASYANYLINNEQVLVPTYQQPEDKLALDTLQKAHPGFRIIGVDCLSLIQQFGSLHCISMQIPKGTLRQEILDLFTTHLSVLKRADR